MAHKYQLREPEYLRRAMCSIIAGKLATQDANLVLYRPLPDELRPTFRQVLEHIEAGVPFDQIPELVKVYAYLDSEVQMRRDFGQFKRDYRSKLRQLAEAVAAPTPATGSSGQWKCERA